MKGVGTSRHGSMWPLSTTVVVTAFPKFAHLLALFGQDGSVDADVHAEMVVLGG